jgi:hypothetical protein
MSEMGESGGKKGLSAAAFRDAAVDEELRKQNGEGCFKEKFRGERGERLELPDPGHVF